MLTGDENIVDIDFSVFWVINNASNYLFNMEDPDGTVKAVAESAMREVVGHSNIQPLLTQARQITETDVQKLHPEDARRVRRRHPGHPGPAPQGRSAGRGHRLVPRRAGGARRPGARCRTRRRPTPTRSCRRRAARPRRSPRPPAPIATGSSPRRKGQADRFDQVYESYKAAPDVTRRRMYLETHGAGLLAAWTRSSSTRSAGGSGVDPLSAARRAQPAPRRRSPRREAANEARHLRRPRPRHPRRRSRSLLYLSVFIVNQTQQALVLRFGQVVAVGVRSRHSPASTTSCR